LSKQRLRERFAGAALLLVVVGAGLRLFQFLANTSLWRDEIRLARNILERSAAELLLQPLDYNQVAPIGFLAAEKAMVLTFGPSDWALRIVPLVVSLVSLILFWTIARKALSKEGMFVPVALFALSPFLISLSSVVKQYGLDVLCSCLVIAIGLRLLKVEDRNPVRILLAVAGGLACLLSTVAVVVSAGAWLALVVAGARSRSTGHRARWLAYGLPVLVWGAMGLFAALWAFSMVTPETSGHMREFWGRAGAFVAPVAEYPTWVVDKVVHSFIPSTLFIPYAGPPVWNAPVTLDWAVVGLACAGVAALISAKRFALLVLLLTPPALAWVLSRAQLYPIGPRTSVYLLPLLILLVAFGVEGIIRLARLGSRASALVLMILIFPSLLAVVRGPPGYPIERNRGLIKILAEHYEAGDAVFAHVYAADPLSYYGTRFGIDRWVTGGQDRSDVRQLLRESDQFRGSERVWVVFGYLPFQSVDRVALLCYLRAIGEETFESWLVGRWTSRPVSLHRFDLSKPALLQKADAASFGIPGSIGPDGRGTCPTRSSSYRPYEAVSPASTSP
jgi:hypothetical protein